MLCGLILGFLSASAIAVERRTEIDGNVILEDVPPVPQELVEQLNRYQNTRAANFVDWTRDGSGMFIVTRFGDTNQLHRVDMPGGARHQLTFFNEPVGEVVRQPQGGLLAIAMDRGGDEFDQIYRLDPATAELTLISDGTSRNAYLLWDATGRQLAFQSTRRDGASNDVWVMDPMRPDSARLALEAPDTAGWWPVQFSRDGSQLLVQHYVSINDSRVHLVDLAGGESRPLVGDASTYARHLVIGFGPDQRGFYFVTDAGREFATLAYRGFDPDSVTTLITADIPWDVDGGILSEDGSRAAFTVNAGGPSELYLLDTATQEYRRVEGLPVGVITMVKFSPDGKRLGMSINSSQSPNDVFSLDLAADPLAHGAPTRWTFSEVGGLDTSKFAGSEFFTYPGFDSVDGKPREIPGLMMKPAGSGPHPVIIVIHGGPESQSRPIFSPASQMWVQRLGAAVIQPNVRGSNGYGKSYLLLDNGMQREDSVRDIGALLDWIGTQPDLDASRVAVIGGSYGGYMVLASAMHYSERLKAAVDIVGISDFVTFLENTESYRRDLRRAEYGDEREPAMRDFLQGISPAHNAGRIRVPLFVAQGQNDPRVPVTESEQIVAAVRASGQPVWYMNALNEGHGFQKKENVDLYQQITVMFFEQHLATSSQPRERSE